MKTQEFILQRYDADEGKVFDWADLVPHQTEDEEGNVVVNHLYAKTLFLGVADSIDNYIEVDEPVAE